MLSGQKVLVTGGAGFIGSALVRALLEEGSEVIVYDNFVSGDFSNLRGIADEIETIEGDILDPKLGALMNRKDVEFVFNLAAEPYIPRCYDVPKRFFEVNAEGALNVMLACKEAGVKRVLQYSSSEVYGTVKYAPMDENHPTLPLSTYAVSKLAADRLCYTLYYEQNVPVIILRQFNAYGPMETHPYIIPELITQLSKGNVLSLGNIEARRDFTYVEDAVKGAVGLMKCKKAVGEVVNLGSGKDRSVKELAETVAELMGRKSVKINIEKSRFRPLDVERLQCDYSKAKKLIGWKPEVSLEEGLRRTIRWHEENNRKWLWEVKIAPEERIWGGR